ncbi:Ferri-bacillibactin esterase BesA [Brevundimonas sp. SH203]|uniref:alpha/beta hydrolase n=1 Tax=Brevundimonas sp. SH203 TaxID=345167 RepID=UPI0009D4C505|nr:alpha/beta hydrolase-fold protein [Brevundimonas sp. SH203]GAW42283.1 Ferri-bacillibactin esterase BesA [Brevundimonas sp. SH203]
MTDPDPADWTPWTAPHWRVRALTGPEGRRMDLMLATPEGEPPPGGWPLLLALDGGRFFAALAGAAAALSHRTEKTGIAPMVVAALAHRPEEGAVEDQRAHDFTRRPCADPGWARPSGGGEAMHRWIADRVLPMLAEAAPVDVARATLFGHSLGGLFVLETLQAEPSLFARWIAVSPSLWWSTPSPDIVSPAVLIGCGEAETARDMRDRIAAWAGARPDGAIFRQAPAADHGSAPFALIPDILRHAGGAGT